MTKTKVWSKQFTLMFFINFKMTLVFFILVTTVVVFATSQYGATASIAGLLSGIFVIGALIGRLLSGFFILRYSSKRILYIGVILFAIASSIYLIEFNLFFFFLLRLMHGFAYGIASTAAATIVANSLPSSRKGEGIGLFSLSMILSTAIGPFLGIHFLQLEHSFEKMFIFNLILSLLMCVLTLFIPKEFSNKSEKKLKKNTYKLTVHDIIEVKVIPISFIALIFGLIYSTLMSFSSHYVNQIGFVKEGSFFFLIYAVIVLLTRPSTGRVMDKKGENIIIYPSLVLFAIGMLLYSQAQVGYLILISALFVGLGYGNFNSIAQTIAIKLTAKERVGLATSTYFIFFDLGLGIGPYIFGYFISIIGYRGVFFTCFIIILLTIILYYHFHGKKKRLHNVEGEESRKLS